ncbi:MAG: polysaccharide deacetylase family protein [Coriobacteriia bacterium]|nr:polysaccharide deacetylase family protein [Coriobacteriia bacterium]
MNASVTRWNWVCALATMITLAVVALLACAGSAFASDDEAAGDVAAAAQEAPTEVAADEAGGPSTAESEEPVAETAPEPDPELATDPEPAAPEPEPATDPEPAAAPEPVAAEEPVTEPEPEPEPVDEQAAEPEPAPAVPVTPAKRAATDTTSTASADEPASTTPAQKESKYAEIAKIKLNQKKVRIENNGKFRFKATLFPEIAGKKIKDKTITWRISNKKIASITEKGVVQGKTAGVAIVTAIASNGKKIQAKVKVVIDKSKMAKRIPVLTYHRITPSKWRFWGDTNLAMTASLFNSQMKWLKKHGYHTISTEEFRDWRVNGTFLPKKSVLITMDDGFYEVYHVVYPILKKYNFKATSFVIGKNIHKTTAKYNSKRKRDRFIGEDVIQKMREEYPNLEFQSHTYNLHHRGKSGNGVAKFWSRKDIDRDFKKMDKYGFTAAAWPFGHTSGNLKAAAKASKSVRIGFGYMMDWAATRTSPLYNIPRFKMFGDRGMGDFIRVVRKAG